MLSISGASPKDFRYAVKLEDEKLAIMFYKVNDSLNSILKCYKSLIDKAEKNLNENQDLIYKLYIEQGEYLCSKKQQKSYFEQAVESYYKAADHASDPTKQQDAMFKVYHTFLGISDNNTIQQIDISEQQRNVSLEGIIGDTPEFWCPIPLMVEAVQHISERFRQDEFKGELRSVQKYESTS